MGVYVVSGKLVWNADQIGYMWSIDITDNPREKTWNNLFNKVSSRLMKSYVL